ncbi:MAG: tetratricopeptide repeat protein [Candidatus Gastranaerophilales bacterium]|nr:tetratricopeptide repeat protein [Candidatus Gastranaerophilales bacterium]
MEYCFIKDIFKSIVHDLRSDNSTLESFLVERETSFILKHNIDALSQILRFLNSADNLFILNGFMGAGKTYVADCFLDFINDNVLIFRNSYQEAINLDDVLLSIFKDFSIYHSEKKISLPKIESNVFSDKINAYIKYCDVPMLFIFDSFEINMRSKDTQKDILDFINYLSHFAKVKIIICSRSFKQTDLISMDSSVSCALKSLSKDEMYEYLNINNITGTKYECEELYKITRGHFLLLELSVLLMNVLDISLTIFASEYKKSSKNFLEFLVSKVLSISSEKFTKLLLLLSIIRHGVSANFLINQRFATEDEIEFLLQKRVIAEKFGLYYLKDYFKSEYIKIVNNETKLKVHKYLLDVYEAELPLKPFDRELFLSRLTMRQEISHHTKKIKLIQEEMEQSGRPRLSEKQGLTYVSYSKSSGYEASMDKKQNSSSKRYTKNIKPRQTKISLSPLPIDEHTLINSAKETSDEVTSILETIPTASDDKSINVEDLVPTNLDDYITIAEKCENSFNFADAIMYYKKALSYKSDSQFTNKEPIIYAKLAFCYRKIQDIDEAVKLYEKVYQLYLEKLPDLANSVLLNIAQMYSEVYKFDKAREIYKRILNSSNSVSNEMAVRVYLYLSELEENNMDVASTLMYVKMALTMAEKIANPSLLCECYFKYALLFDDSNNTEMAMKNYLRCIQTSSDASVNPYLASSYSNLAAISLDNKNPTVAKMYYELSIKADESQNNYDGLCFSYLKLASLVKKEDKNKTHDYLLKAVAAAKKMEDRTAIVPVYVELGDYHLYNGDYKQSLKSYLLALKFIPQQSEEDVHSQVNMQINKIKTLVGESEFKRIMLELKNKK